MSLCMQSVKACSLHVVACGEHAEVGPCGYCSIAVTHDVPEAVNAYMHPSQLNWVCGGFSCVYESHVEG